MANFALSRPAIGHDKARRWYGGAPERDPHRTGARGRHRRAGSSAPPPPPEFLSPRTGPWAAADPRRGRARAPGPSSPHTYTSKPPTQNGRRRHFARQGHGGSETRGRRGRGAAGPRPCRPQGRRSGGMPAARPERRSAPVSSGGGARRCVHPMVDGGARHHRDTTSRTAREKQDLRPAPPRPRWRKGPAVPHHHQRGRHRDPHGQEQELAGDSPAAAHRNMAVGTKENRTE
jgi:hypothetical protein